MKLKTRLLILAGSLGLATLLSSCQTTGTATTATDAVMCDKCKTVWVKQPTNLGAPGHYQTTVYSDKKKMTCPDCQLAVANFWKTGQMTHTCSHCGGALTHCTLH